MNEPDDPSKQGTNAPTDVPITMPRSRARRIARAAAWSVAGLFGLLILLIAIGAWLLGREATLQRIVVEAEKALHGQLTIEGVTGSIYDRVAFDRLVYRTETQVITIEKGSLRYALEPFARRFTIDDARAKKLTIAIIGKSDEPTKEPDTLELPAAMRIDTLRITALHLDAIDIVQKEAMTSLTDADLRGRYAFENGRKRWIVESVALKSPWGTASGTASVAATKPFAIDARLLAEGKAFDVPYRAPLAVAGKLADLQLSSDFSLSDPKDQPLAGHATAHVLPFHEQPIADAMLHVAGISPKRWKTDLPEADIAVDANLVPLDAPLSNPAPGAGAGLYPFRGTLRVVNGAPGRIDRDHIPVAALNADLTGGSLSLVFSRIVADLGAAGHVSGKGSYVFANGGTPSFDGVVRALDLRAIHGKLIGSKFAGPLAISRREGVIHIDTTLADAGRSVKLRGELEGQEIRIAEARVVLGASRVAASGTVDLAKSRPFDLKGEVAHLNPRDFGDFPKAELNAAFKLAGTMGAPATARNPQVFRVAADLRIEPSRVMERPVAGTVVGTVEGAIADRAGARLKEGPAVAIRQIANANIALAFGANRIDAQGDFGRPQDRLKWNVDAPRLADLGAGVSGSLKGQGFLGGTFDEPAIDFTIAGDGLRVSKSIASASVNVAKTAAAPAATTVATTKGADDKTDTKAAARAATATTIYYSLKTLRGQGRLLAGPSGILDADIALTEFRDGPGPTPAVQSAEGHVKGTRDAHTLTLTAKSDRFDIATTAHGGLEGNSTWRGTIDKLASRGRVPFALARPATLLASKDEIDVGATLLKFNEGQVDLQRLTYSDGQIVTAGSATGFPLAIVGTFSRDFSRQVATSLKFGGRWDLRIGDAIDGSVKLFRESGNIQFLTEPRFNVEPDKIDVSATIVANRVSAQVSAAGRGLGRIEAAIDTRLSKRDGQWGLAGDAPLALKSDIDIPDLRWLARLSGRPGLDLYGRLQVAVTGHGTVAHPLLAGHASGDAVGVRWPDQGINFRDGHLDMDFDGDRVILKEATLAAGNGHLNANGDLRLADRKVSGSLAVKLDKFEAIARTDRTMVVSGTGTARFGTAGIELTADLKADRGSLQLAERRGPILSDDIVIVGREKADEDVPAKSVPVRFEVKFDMGDDFKVKGSGFDGKLGGVIRIAGVGTDLRAIGTVAVREGTYEAYGQRLTIDRGNLTFSGPIDNPALDIHAVRKNLAVEAGVQISGTALAPQARLTSNPSVPDTEKLSWLVLGHGLSGSSKSDFGLLTTAAASLLGSSDSVGIQSRIAATLGVDEIGVSGLGGDRGGLLTIGKQISSRLRVTFEQGFTKAATLLKIRYNIYQRVDLQVQTGTESAVDVFYTFSFD